MSQKRNASCPCGSGKKFKHCCWGRKEKASVVPARRNWNGLWAGLGLLVVGPGVALLVWSQRPPEPEVRPEPMRLIGQPAGVSEPSPYYYDRANNRYWDPGHAHWHDGPPPLGGGLQTALPQAEATPAPYYYDEANNRYWDPGHAHWHQGPPPAGVR